MIKSMCLKTWVALVIFLVPAMAQVKIQQITPFSGQVKPHVAVTAGLEQGEPDRVRLTLIVDPELHINSHQPLEDFLIPTLVKMDPADGIQFGPVSYPEAKKMKFAFSETDMSVYDGTVVITVPVLTGGKKIGDDTRISGTVRYQACSNTSCFAPKTETFAIGSAAPVAAGAETPAMTTDEAKARQIIAKGILYALITFFLFGMALNLTPCVYPVIPITIGFFSQQGGQHKGRTAFLALFYILGIAAVFALLGLVSSLAGKQWGFLFQNTWFIIIIVMIMLAMAASMFGAFEITLPSWLMMAGNKTRQGVTGSLVMGLLAGAIIAPCATGIIIGLVSIVASSGMVIRGTLLFFAMGLGLGLPYLVLAVFSGKMAALPKSGMWMVWIKKVFGLVLIGIALYFLTPQLKHVPYQFPFLLGILMIFGGLYLGFLDHAPGYTRSFKLIKSALGLALIAGGIIFAGSGMTEKSSGITWQHFPETTIAEALQDGKPVFLDYYADWCAPCKKMDRTTFMDPKVAKAAEKWTFLKIDCTSPAAPEQAMMAKYKVSGMPTFIFLDTGGQEKTDLRTTGYMDTDELLGKMGQVR